MAASNFDLKGFLNDPKVQADKPGAIKFLQSKGIIDQNGQVVPGMVAPPTPPTAPGLPSLEKNLAATPGAIMGASTAVANAVAPNLTNNLSTAFASIAHPFDSTIQKGLTPPTAGQALGGQAELGGIVSGLPAVEKAGAALAVREGAKLLEMVSPRLTPGVAADAVKSAPTGIMGKITAIPSKYTKQMADVAKGIVDTGKTFSENAGKVEKTIVQKAQKLEADLKASKLTYTPAELNKALKSVELPDYIKTADKTVKKTSKAIIDKFNELGANNKGTLDGLLKARREFDVWVKKQYPKVFDREGIAVNDLVKNIRTAANDFLARKAGDNVAVKNSLKEQSLLYDVADVLNEKAASGAPTTAGEIGSTYISRFKEAHPLATKIGAGVLGVAGYEEAKKLPVIGKILP